MRRGRLVRREPRSTRSTFSSAARVTARTYANRRMIGAVTGSGVTVMATVEFADSYTDLQFSP
jgi:hypothetical protein